MMFILSIVFGLLYCNDLPKEKVIQISNIQAEQKEAAQTPDDTVFNRRVIYSSSDNGATWLPMSNGLPKDVQVSYFEKKGNEIVLATDNKGIFITDKNRTSWKDIGQSLPNPKINALHVSGDEIYAGLYRQGVYMTKDNGENWFSLNEGLPNLSVRAIIKVKGELIAATDIGIFKTQNGLKNWKGKFSGAQISSLNGFDGKIIAGTSSGVLLSINGGENWKYIHNKGAVHYTSIVDGKVFILYISGDVFMSGDWGLTWTSFNYTPRQRAYIYELTLVGNYLLMSNNYGVFRSIDYGKNWEHIYKEERFVFFDFIVFDNFIYGGTRFANEFRNRK